MLVIIMELGVGVKLFILLFFLFLNIYWFFLVVNGFVKEIVKDEEFEFYL